MNVKKIVKKAEQLSKYFEFKTFEDGQTRVICNADFESKEWKECLDILSIVDDSCALGWDSSYNFTMEALNAIVDSQPKTEQDIDDIACYIESDIYTSNLTDWLAESTYHVEYLTEVLENDEPRDGYQLLALAQVKAKAEAYTAVLYALEKLTK